MVNWFKIKELGECGEKNNVCLVVLAVELEHEAEPHDYAQPSATLQSLGFFSHLQLIAHYEPRIQN